ncbi:MAG: circularly permuted type 2 ATP-grasp protein [Chloroflexota bacterium]|nr:circularly permuted type 2 ATP-grasp protein [Chloroflexota bacterium]
MISAKANPAGDPREYLDSQGRIRPEYQAAFQLLEGLGKDRLGDLWRQGRREAQLDAFSFLLDPRVYRSIPIDWIPRVVPRREWEVISAGVSQRLKALNLFLTDLYNGQQSVVPEDVIYSCQYFYPEYQDFRPARDVFVHIYGSDLVRLEDGRYVVLEDNLRIPSGITYQLKSCQLLEKLMPELVSAYDIVPFDIRETYLDMFHSLCDGEDPVCVLLTDSKLGAAFFEHRYLAELLGIPLVEGSDLYIGAEGRVMLKSPGGDVAVDLVYRRVEDLEIFVPGLTDAYLEGKVALVNGMGTSAADDKLVFQWVPEMIRHYLDEEPVLDQAVSYDLRYAESRHYVIQNLDRMVIKTRQGYGGLGVYVMPDLDEESRIQLGRRIVEQPRMFVAQETLDFSRHLIFDDETGEFEDRYIDLRVFAVQNGRGETTAFPGGLTRVSQANSRITNNSSGGLCKPTWVVR